jgi:hypothetical protein
MTQLPPAPTLPSTPLSSEKIAVVSDSNRIFIPVDQDIAVEKLSKPPVADVLDCVCHNCIILPGESIATILDGKVVNFFECAKEDQRKGFSIVDGALQLRGPVTLVEQALRTMGLDITRTEDSGPAKPDSPDAAVFVAAVAELPENPSFLTRIGRALGFA